jgi:hypothetical protein
VGADNATTPLTRNQYVSVSHQLDSLFDCSLKDADCIVEQENSRRLRLQNLLLEDDNLAMSNQLCETEVRVEELENERDVLCTRLEQVEQDRRGIEVAARAKDRELVNLQVRRSPSYKTLSDLVHRRSWSL